MKGLVDTNFPNPPEVEDHVSTTAHKQLSVTILNLHSRNFSILIVTFLFITYVKLPGSKGKGIQIPLHVTAAFTTHSTNTKIQLIGLVY
jgi:hypothetical protein